MGQELTRRGGYTILEVLVAVAILSLVLPAISSMVITSRKTQVGTLRFENAASFAQQVVDSLQRAPAIRLQDTGTSVASINGQPYTASWAATQDALGGSLVAVTVGWNVGGKRHSLVLRGALR